MPSPNRSGNLGETWWSARFVHVLESFAIGSRLKRGRSYARSGRVLEMRVEPGLVSARVQGSLDEPYDVRIGVKTLSGQAWTRLEKALAGQALFAARLLAGEMPHEIEEVFATLDLSLFPASRRELVASCSCPDAANPCKHIAATFYILAQAFDEDPFVIFAWRGRTRDALVASLRRLRGAAAAVRKASATDADAPAEDAPPLAASITGFWRTDPAFAGLHVAPHASESADALLRQLGPLPPEAGGTQLLERLASAYRVMATGAERLAYVDPPDPAELHDPRAGARFYNTDLRDLEPEDGRELEPPARRLYEFFSRIVKTATSIPADEEVHTPVRCRRRLGRSPCRGHLDILLTEDVPEIRWRCAVCGDAGVLHGWECSFHDLGGRLPPSPDEPWVEATLSHEEYALLETLDPTDLSTEQLVRGARYEPGAIRLLGTREEFASLSDELDDAITASYDSGRRQRLRRLREALEI